MYPLDLGTREVSDPLEELFQCGIGAAARQKWGELGAGDETEMADLRGRQLDVGLRSSSPWTFMGKIISLLFRSNR